MIIARGFVEARDVDCVAVVADALRERGFEINEINGKRIVYRIGKNKFAEARPEIEALRKLDGVRRVYLAYYSLERPGQEESFDTDQINQ